MPALIGPQSPHCPPRRKRSTTNQDRLVCAQSCGHVQPCSPMFSFPGYSQTARCGGFLGGPPRHFRWDRFRRDLGSSSEGMHDDRRLLRCNAAMNKLSAGQACPAGFSMANATCPEDSVHFHSRALLPWPLGAPADISSSRPILARDCQRTTQHRVSSPILTTPLSPPQVSRPPHI